MQDRKDWNSLPLVPTKREIQAGMIGKHHLQPIKIGRSYASVAEYLDTYFRLLRADCFNGICSGIYEYLRGKLQARDMRMHTDVQLVGIQMNIFQNSVVLLLKTPTAGGASNHYHKLMFGSLLCLSVSKLFDDPIWATIVDSDVEINGTRDYISIELVSQYNSCSSSEAIQLLCSSGSFIMAESPTYYRSYEPVMSALQDMDMDKMPFKHSLVYNIMPQCPPGEKKTSDMTHILKGLDQSQKEAFKMTIDTEIAIIQGPPGTGKTYIGSKLVEALTTMSDGTTLPIVILAYKNRALDEFLEHIYPLYPNGIARIGRTSSNSNIKKCNLSELKKRHRKSAAIYRKMKNLKSEADYVIRKIKELTTALESSLSYDASLICQWMSYQQKQNFKKKCVKGLGHGLFSNLIEQWIPDKKTFEEVMSKHQIVQHDVEHTMKLKAPQLQEDQIGLDIDEEKMERWAALDYDHTTDKNQMHLFKPTRSCITLWPLVAQKLFPEPPSSLLNIADPWNLTPVQRVYVIQYLLWERSQTYQKELERYIADYEENREKRKELDNTYKANILRRKKIIGLTVTGACINRDILKQLRPEIVIVEEAAEILESHLIGILGNYVKHLILIGDHQQLKPSVQSYVLEKDYSFNTSMMERLIRNGLPYATLHMQNRMRPEFAELLKDIYPGLKNNPRVHQNEAPRCMGKSMFFWTHPSPEIPGRSFKNDEEANRAVYLALFLLSHGYNASQISILGAYQKQVQLIRDKLKDAEKNYPQLFREQSLSDTNKNKLLVHTIDNFQGDENDIVIISLVRSNVHNNIGFLSRLDRRCVSQSRAKCGMYFLGNHEVLKSNKNWLKLLVGMQRVECIGYNIMLQCPKQQADTQVLIKDAKDIKHMLPGFCKEQCTYIYPCGKKHQCKQPCHPDHVHTCCKTKVTYRFKKCGHKLTILCGESITEFLCNRDVTVPLPCGHTKEVKCYESYSGKLECQEKCRKLLVCKHLCEGICGESCVKRACRKCMKIREAKEASLRAKENELILLKHRTQLLRIRKRYPKQSDEDNASD